MLTIRAETPDDMAGIHAVVALAFGRDNEARLIAALRASPDFVPTLSLVAVEEGAIVGHILFSPIAIRTPQRAVPALALAPLAVRPDRQNGGVGSALVRHGVAACRQQGHAIVVVLGHAQYYPRFGFTTARSKGVEPPWPVNDAAFMVQELIAGALNGVCGVVEYPPAFAAV